MCTQRSVVYPAPIRLTETVLEIEFEEKLEELLYISSHLFCRPTSVTHQTQLFTMQTLDSAGTDRDAHQWHHNTPKLAIAHVDAQFREQSLSDAHQWHHSSSRPAGSPCRRSISKAPAHDMRQGQHCTSKPTIRPGSEMLNRKLTLKRLMFGCMPGRAPKGLTAR